MSTLISQLESILFLAVKPMKEKELLKATGAKKGEFNKVIESLKAKYNQENSGIKLIDHDGAFQFTSAPENAELVEKVYQSEMSGELTKPALETLTIIAYRGPISKPELELIRGINCSLILRNLAMRGLIQEKTSGQGKAGDDLLATYTVHPEFLQYLGITSVKDLPEYSELHSHELLQELIKQRTEVKET